MKSKISGVEGKNKPTIFHEIFDINLRSSMECFSIFLALWPNFCFGKEHLVLRCVFNQFETFSFPKILSL